MKDTQYEIEIVKSITLISRYLHYKEYKQSNQKFFV